MCGIAGLIAPAGLPEFSRVLRSMSDSISHRGPDDEGFFETTANNGSCRIGLGHRRLSIIDLDTGHQPLANEDGTVYVIFNGEIYNYQELRTELIARGHCFKTKSDTETISKEEIRKMIDKIEK